MDPFKIKRTRRDGPEAKIQEAWIKFLLVRGWYCVETHGTLYQSGLPDVFITHSKYGTRWTEVKNPEKWSFTPAQIEVFPKLIANGCGVWIITAANELEYKKIFEPCNYHMFLSIMSPTRRGGA